MNFITYVNSIPNARVDEIDMIAKLTMSSTSTVYRWLNGSVKVPPVKKKIIAEYYGKPIEELFPENE